MGYYTATKMNYLALELTGTPAFLFILLIVTIVAYVLLYIPMKLIISAVAHGRKRTEKYQLLKQRTVIAEYDPPAGLTPAEMGFLYDTQLSIAEVYATVIYLEHQGLIKLADNKGKLEIISTQPATAELQAFEAYVLQALSERVGQTISKRMLRRIRRWGDQTIKVQLRQKDLIVSASEQLKRSLLRLGYIWVSMVLFTALVFHPHTWPSFMGFMFAMVFFFPLYAIIAAFLYMRFQRIAGEPWLATPKLKEIWSDVEGYYQFIKLVELDNLQFDSKTTNGVVKNKVLPYAIALGFDTGWSKKV